MSEPLVPDGLPTTLRSERLKMCMVDPDNESQCEQLLSLIKDGGGAGRGGNSRTNIRSIEQVHMKHKLMSPRNRPECCTRTPPPRGMFHLVYLANSEHPDDDSQDALVGMIGMSFRSEVPWPDIGFGISLKYEGHGYASEAGREVLRFWQDQVGVREVCVCTLEDNVKSHRMAQRLGFMEGGPSNIVFGHPPNEQLLHGKAFILPGMTWRNDWTIRPTVGPS